MIKFYLKLIMALVLVSNIATANDNGVVFGLGAGTMHSSYKANDGKDPLYSGLVGNLSLDLKLGYQHYVWNNLAVRSYGRWAFGGGTISADKENLKNVEFNIKSVKTRTEGNYTYTTTQELKASGTNGMPNFYNEFSINADLVYTLELGVVNIDLLAGLGLASTIDMLGLIHQVVNDASPTFVNVPFHLGLALGSSKNKVEFLFSMPFASNSVKLDLSKYANNSIKNSLYTTITNAKNISSKHMLFTISWVHVF